MRFERGVQFYKAGSYELALIEFRRAYQLVDNYRVLYNVGQTCYQMRDYACALQSFHNYLSAGGAEIAKDRRLEVAREIESLKSLVASLSIEVEAGAEVEIDDAPMGRSPFPDPLVVNPGHHRIKVTKAGRVPAVRQVTLASSDRATLQFSLDPIDQAGPAASVSVPVSALTYSPPAAVPPRTPPLWIGWVASGALAAGAVVTGILAWNQSDQLKQDRDTVPMSRSTLEDHRSRASSLALTSDILSAAAILTAGGTLYLTLKTGTNASQSHAEVRPALSGIRLVGSF